MADPGWLVQWREEYRRERLAAMRAEFYRCVDEEDMPDTKEAWRAFVHGWLGVQAFEAAKKARTEAGQGSYTLAIMGWLFGSMVLAMTALSYFTIPADKLNTSMMPKMVLFGLLMIGGGFLAVKRFRRVSEIAGDKHRKRWGNPDTITLDAQDKSS